MTFLPFVRYVFIYLYEWICYIGKNTFCIHKTLYGLTQATASMLKDLSIMFGDEWVVKEILPTIKSMYHSKDKYVRRLTALYVVQNITQSVSLMLIDAHVVPILAALAEDTVANVRFNVAKIIQTLLMPQVTWACHSEGDAGGAVVIGCLYRGALTRLLAILDKMLDDSDRDVRFFAEKAYEEYKLGSRK
jgi:serine/threonine-protein phosphatase 2A regulatory subunit A